MKSEASTGPFYPWILHIKLLSLRFRGMKCENSVDLVYTLNPALRIHSEMYCMLLASGLHVPWQEASSLLWMTQASSSKGRSLANAVSTYGHVPFPFPQAHIVINAITAQHFL